MSKSETYIYTTLSASSIAESVLRSELTARGFTDTLRQVTPEFPEAFHQKGLIGQWLKFYKAPQEFTKDGPVSAALNRAGIEWEIFRDEKGLVQRAPEARHTSEYIKKITRPKEGRDDLG